MRCACLGSVFLLCGALLAAPAPEVKVTSSVLLREILQDLTLPPLGAGERGEVNKPWPAFGPGVMAKYRDGAAPDARLKETLRKAQVAIWAVSPTAPPRELAADVQKVRSRLGFDGGIKTHFPAPPPGPAENQFKVMLVREHKMLARAQEALEEIQDELAGLKETRDKAAPRWQATYDVMLARLHSQQVALDEIQDAYGKMRKEFPTLAPGHTAWQLLTVETIHQADSKKAAKQASKILAQVQREHAGTVWAEMARRLEAVPLGLEWQSVP